MDSYPDEKPFKIQRRIDRISELPDPILAKILCFLPTKDAFAAAILSTRWKNLFPIWIPPTPVKLDLDDGTGRASSFLYFVDKLFNETLRDVPCLDTMTLKCKKVYGDDKFLSWVRAAVELNVRELRLKSYMYDSLPLFYSLNECTKLTLELTGRFNLCFDGSNIKPTKLKTLNLCNIVFGVDEFSGYDMEDSMMTTLSNVCPELEELSFIDCDLLSLGSDHFIKFPRLKTLKIWNSSGTSCKVTIQTPNLKTLDLFNVLFDVEYDASGAEYGCDRMSSITGFPRLEELFLTDCDWQGVHDLIIESHLLRSLIIRNSMRSAGRLTLNTPNLQLLLLNDCITNYNLIYPFNSLCSTHIDVGPRDTQLAAINKHTGYTAPWYYKCVIDLVRYCCDTRHLFLATRSIEVLRHVPVDLPMFNNLASLKLGCLGRSGWEVLACLLCSAPSLEKLVFEKGFEEYKGGYEEFESIVSTPPICLKLNLKEIEFLEFNDVKDGFKLIEYFLKNSEVMQRLKIQCLPIKNSSSLNNLLKLSLKSKVAIALACWKDEMLLKEISSHLL